MIKIFVYGTLKEGFSLYKSYNNRKSIIKNVIVSGTLFNLGPFPAAKFNTNNTIIGEVHTFYNKDKILKIMDKIEGYDSKNIDTSLYIRKIIDIVYKNKKEKVYAYEFNFNKYSVQKTIIKTGIWK